MTSLIARVWRHRSAVLLIAALGGLIVHGDPRYTYALPYEEAAYVTAAEPGFTASADAVSYTHPPGYVWFLRVLHSVGIDSALPELRIFSIFAFAATAAIIFMWVRVNGSRLHETTVTIARKPEAAALSAFPVLPAKAEAVALLAALAVMTNPLILDAGWSARPEIYACLAFVAFLAALDAFLQSRRRRWCIAATAAAILVCLFNIYGVLLVWASLAVWSLSALAVKPRNTRKLTWLLLPAAAVSLACALCPKYLPHLASLKDHYWGAMKHGGPYRCFVDFSDSVWEQSFDLFARPAWDWLGTVLGLSALVLVAFVWLGRCDTRTRALASTVAMVEFSLLGCVYAFGFSPVIFFLTPLLIVQVLALVLLAFRLPWAIVLAGALLILGDNVFTLYNQRTAVAISSDTAFGEVARILDGEPPSLPIVVAGPRLYEPLHFFLSKRVLVRTRCYLRGPPLGEDNWCGVNLVDAHVAMLQAEWDQRLPHDCILVHMESGGSVYPSVRDYDILETRAVVHPSLAVGSLSVQRLRAHRKGLAAINGTRTQAVSAQEQDP